MLMNYSSTLNLKNHFLLASPHLQDDALSQSLIYICRHDKQGTFGLMINRPIYYTNIAQLFEELDVPVTVPDLHKKLPLKGGTVNPEVGFVLHTGQPVWSSSIVVSENVCMTTSRDILQGIASGQGVTYFEICLGYSGWTTGQLEQEVEQGDWLVVPADMTILFDTPVEQRWQTAVDKLGVDFDKLSWEIGHA